MGAQRLQAQLGDVESLWPLPPGSWSSEGDFSRAADTRLE